MRALPNKSNGFSVVRSKIVTDQKGESEQRETILCGRYRKCFGELWLVFFVKIFKNLTILEKLLFLSFLLILPDGFL